MKRLFSVVFLLCICLTSAVFAKTGQEQNFFTHSQEQYLAEHPQIYAYFSDLYVGQKTPLQIGKEYHLSERKNVQYLHALANIGVIEKPKAEGLSSPVKFLVQGVSRFRVDGPLAKKFDALMVKQFFEKVLKDLKGKKVEFSTPGLYLTEKQHKAYLKELNDLGDKYIDISVANKKNSRKDAYRVSGFMSLIPNWAPALFSDIK